MIPTTASEISLTRSLEYAESISYIQRGYAEPFCINHVICQGTMDATRLADLIASLPGADRIICAARYQNSTDDCISPDFQFIDDGDEASTSWFDSDFDAAAQFVPFAQSNDGGLFAYWKCEGCTPIVYLASECEGTRVIARDTAELLSIVAFGSETYVIDIEYTDQDEEWDGPEETPESLNAFREWLDSECGVKPSESPLATVKRAMAESPNLMAWVREWQDWKYGTQAK